MPRPPRTVLIAGAGDVGLALARRLLVDGVAVTTLNRSGRTVEGATAVRADLAAPITLDPPAAFDAVVLTTAPDGRDVTAYHTAYVDGPAHLLAALATTPARVVLTSTTGVHGEDDGSWVDADTPPAPLRPTAAAVVEGEQRLAAAAPTVVVRAAGIYGPGRERLVNRVRAGEEPVAGGPAKWTNRIHRDDLVEALAVALSHPDPLPVLLAVDDEPAPRAEVVRWLAARLGIEPPPGEPAPFETGKRCRNDALRALGWVPRYPSYREGYATMLDARSAEGA